MTSRRQPSWAALACALVATPAFAGDIVSAKPDAVSVTVYRDQPRSAEQLRGDADGGDDTTGLAMISETRTVELPAGESRIRFAGVADAIIPASAKVEGLPGAEVERDFDYDLLNPASLIEKSLGGPVTIRRVDPKTGRVSEEAATLRSGPNGVTVETARGVEALGCGDGPSALVFDRLPPGLADKPTLSVIAHAAKAGRYQLTLSYLAVRVDWSADYVARVAPDGKTLDLTGWLTLSNRSGASFENAPTAVVAGHLARVDPDLPDIKAAQRADACWPMGRTSDWVRLHYPDFERREGRMQEVPVAVSVFTGSQRDVIGISTVADMANFAVASELGDYKLYTLPEPTTLAARETKQIRFLHRASAKFEKLHVLEVEGAADMADAPNQTQVVLRLENKDENGLGLPLPGGNVSFRQAQGGDELYSGEAELRDVPVKEPFELKLGETSSVSAKGRVVADTTSGWDAWKRERIALVFTVTNATAEPAIFELRQPPDGEGFKVTSESARHKLRDGLDVWRLTVPAGGTAELRYAYEIAAD